ncbi:hypothetical protein AB836_02125 [Rickettsiales bacterium (ex Bugula neritina AB1)]|nr:hypothetical protein AB836_02125 [Rickettsiales bacterium (ex Bugula neritina AB1)]
MRNTSNNWQDELNRLVKHANKLKIPDLFNLEDPHLKQLLEATSFMITDIKNDLEKFEPFLIQQLFAMLYPNNYISSSKCIVEYSPIKKKIKNNSIFITSNNCYFRSLEDVCIYPMTIINIEILENKSINNKLGNFLYIHILSTEKIFNLSINELQFYTKNHEIIESIFSEDHQKEVIFTENHLIFQTGLIKWKIPTYTNGIQKIEEYINLKELYNFFILKEMNLNNIDKNLHIYIPISFINIQDLHLKLNTFVLENSFEGTTEPIKIDFKNIKYILKPNSSKENIYIKNVKNIVICDKTSSYDFGFFTNDNKDGWGIEQDENFNIYLTLFTDNMEKMYEKIIYGEVVFFNGKAVNEIFYDNYFTNDSSLNFLELPRYKKKNFSFKDLIVYMNTDFKKLLVNDENFKNVLNDLFKIFNIRNYIEIIKIHIQEDIKLKKWSNISLPIKGYKLDIVLTSNNNNIFGFLKMLHGFVIDLSTTDMFIDMIVHHNNKTYYLKENLN